MASSMILLPIVLGVWAVIGVVYILGKLLILADSFATEANNAIGKAIRGDKE